jgi:hypothetical protein
MKILYWLPRSLAIIYIIFLGLFSLDVFEAGSGFSALETAKGFLIHNIPSFIFMALLAIAWKREKAGGIIFIASSVAWLLFLKHDSFWAIANPVILSPIVIGILFLLSDFKNKKAKI